MAVSSVTRIWTLVQHAVRAILAYFGFAAPAATAAPATAAGLLPAQTGPDAAARRGITGPVRWTPPRTPPPLERSLPPTIKQRIHAEAHGSSPSVRRVSCGPDDGTDAAPAAGPARSALAPGRRTGTPGTPGHPEDRAPGAAVVRPRRRV